MKDLNVSDSMAAVAAASELGNEHDSDAAPWSLVPVVRKDQQPSGQRLMPLGISWQPSLG